MPGDSIHAVARVTERFEAVRSRATRLRSQRDRLDEELNQTEQEVRDLGVRIEKLGKVSELFRLLLDLLVDKEVRVAEEIVTESFRTIFPDRNLSFEAEMDTKYNKPSVDFFVRKGPKDDPVSHRGNPLEAFGGGPASVASLVLRTMTILRMKRFPLLFLDETLNAVSDSYIDDLGKFLQHLAKKLRFDILLVTHKPAFLEHAENGFRCDDIGDPDGTRRLLVKGLK